MTVPDQVENRHTNIARTGFGDIHAALAWAVQTLDREFQGQRFIAMHIEEYETSEGDDEWVAAWSAYVSGGRENRPHSGEH